MVKTISGFNSETAKNLILDAGAIFVGFDIENDTYETAKATKLIGATSGGNTFEAKPEFRNVEVDGVKGKAKSLSFLTSWEVTMSVNLLEFREETFKYGLAAVNSNDLTIGGKDYVSIKARNDITDTDYLDNITFVGTISGSSEPVIIQVYNALNLEGLSVNAVDGDDVVAELVFTGHYDPEDLDNPPFAIFYPKKTSGSGNQEGTKTTPVG